MTDVNEVNQVLQEQIKGTANAVNACFNKIDGIFLRDEKRTLEDLMTLRHQDRVFRRAQQHFNSVTLMLQYYLARIEAYKSKIGKEERR